MKFSGKMCPKIILKATKNQSFILFVEDKFFRKTTGSIHPAPRPPAPFFPAVLGLRLKKTLYIFFKHLLTGVSQQISSK